MRRAARYVTHSVDERSVQLVMSRLPGRPLDQWLYGGGAALRDLRGIAAETTVLLRQFVPAMRLFADFALHRDISAHNALIDASGLVSAFLDLGMAVQRGSWTWQWWTGIIGRDRRYWSPDTWTFSAYGHAAPEEEDPGYRRQEEERLGHLSFGVLLLDAPVGLWSAQECDLSGVPGVLAARAAWEAYGPTSRASCGTWAARARRATRQATVPHAQRRRELPRRRHVEAAWVAAGPWLHLWTAPRRWRCGSWAASTDQTRLASDAEEAWGQDRRASLSRLMERLWRTAPPLSDLLDAGQPTAALRERWLLVTMRAAARALAEIFARFFEQERCSRCEAAGCAYGRLLAALFEEAVRQREEAWAVRLLLELRALDAARSGDDSKASLVLEGAVATRMARLAHALLARSGEGWRCSPSGAGRGARQQGVDAGGSRECTRRAAA